MTTQSTALAPIQEVRKNLEVMAPQFKSALPAHISVEKFVRVANTAIQNTPDLLSVDRKTLYSACMRAAQDGLLPDGREAAIVKFGDRAQYMPMVAGILKKVRNSGELLSITSQVIYKADRFRYWVDADGEHLEYEPNFFGDRGDLIGVFAIAKTKDGGIYVEVMTVGQLEAVRKVSRARGGPWDGPFFDEMCRKTVIRRLAKRLPMSTDLEATITADDEMYENGVQGEPATIEATPAQSISDLNQKLRLKKSAQKPRVNLPETEAAQTNEPPTEGLASATEETHF